ncbi:MAG: elongation factor P maturation arginine rhamnosyltransferase EarP [Betaproteobacteria bacterium]|nr:MAG: elongation factor P maturation arginine rhamnosyltransferase EarP [Betaproteobacteria bacterium]
MQNTPQNFVPRSDDAQAAPSLDLFCRVVDNYGDIGVCWRLARQLSAEFGWRVRLIVDDLRAFQWIAPDIAPSLPEQRLAGIDVLLWSDNLNLQPADVVIEAFACDPPANYVRAMSNKAIKPIWINLEYLSAEAWVDGVHGLPSPHRQLPLLKHFFVPGFTEQSGGLICERDVSVAAQPSANNVLSKATQRVFVFAYPHAPVAALAQALCKETSLPAPEFHLASPIKTPFPELSRVQHISPVPQTQFDALLAGYDLLIVRGEDSFLRAQWAAKPMLWHIYPTDDGAHIVKLNAWLDRYCVGMDAATERAYRQASLAFNQSDADPANYADFARQLAQLAQHAIRWRETLLAQDHLAARLVRFVALAETRKVG